MKSFIITLLFCISLPAIANQHKFYVSLTEVIFQQKEQRFTVQTKLFYDDLQKVLYLEDGIELGDEAEPYKKNIETYIKNHFIIEINGEVAPLTLDSLEFEIDALWCNFHGSLPTFKVQEITITNSIFVDLIPSQSNLVNVYKNPNSMRDVKGLMLNRKKQKGSITFN